MALLPMSMVLWILILAKSDKLNLYFKKKKFKDFGLAVKLKSGDSLKCLLMSEKLIN